MSTHDPSRTMNQNIFQAGLSTEAVSAYLLCCSLADERKIISTKNLLGLWNSTHKALIASLNALEEKEIIQKMITDPEGDCIYELTDVHEWIFSQRP